MVKLTTLLASLALLTPSFSAPTSDLESRATNPWNDPNLVSMFDGKTLTGWIPSSPAGWIVKNGSLHSTGNARGYLYYKQSYGNFRWIFQVRQIINTQGSHYPCVLVWGLTPPPAKDALAAIQFQPPSVNHWDYRPGHNNAGNGLFHTVKNAGLNRYQWSQCEIIADMKTATMRMACCQLPAGAASCKAVEIIDFTDKTAPRVGPLGLQVHNAGIQDEYRGLYVESPIVTKPGAFITT